MRLSPAASCASILKPTRAPKAMGEYQAAAKFVVIEPGADFAGLSGPDQRGALVSCAWPRMAWLAGSWLTA